MKLQRLIAGLALLSVLLLASNFRNFAASPNATSAQIATTLGRLQGNWEGEGAGGKCSITIEGNSLQYRAGTNWHKTTFTLPAGKDPQQLHATIKDSWPPSKDTIGAVIPAIFKIEDGTLTLGAFDISQEPPKTFDDVDANSKYVLKRVQPKKENPKPPKTE